MDSGGVGDFSSLAFNHIGNPAISYYDYTNMDLKYAYFDGSIWNLEIVDNQGDVGAYTSLAFDLSGNPIISYKDSTNYDLKFATATPSLIPPPVGGIAFPPDKLALLAPYIILAASIAIAAVSVAVYWRRRY